MAQVGASDGIACVQALATADAFVWGCVDVDRSGAKPQRGANSGRPHATAYTDQALRKAVIHLRQLVPDDGLTQPFSKYVAALHGVFGAAQPVEMMVDGELPTRTRERFADAVRNVRACLEAGTPPAADESQVPAWHVALRV
jgi:hypothetical protein